MWQVTNGEHAGLYVDGTFGHVWPDFDAAVDPPGDAADNAVNVDPFAVRGANQVWRLRPDLGSGAPDGGAPDVVRGGPFVWRAEYRVRGGDEAAFAAAARQLRGAAGCHAAGRRPALSAGAFPPRLGHLTRSVASESAPRRERQRTRRLGALVSLRARLVWGAR